MNQPPGRNQAPINRLNAGTITFGVTLGVVIGVVTGVAMDDIGIGIGFGIGVAIALAMAYLRHKQPAGS